MKCTPRFTDADLRRVMIDYENDTCVTDWELCVGDPEGRDRAARERRRKGRLTFAQLLFWACEPPTMSPTEPAGELWLTSEGPLGEGPTDEAKRLADTIPADAEAWYLYFSDLNVYAYVAAGSARFEWL
jgi:hypothetical protein